MFTTTSKNDTRRKIHSRIRKRLQGTTERPRLNIYRSVGHIYAQVIDDSKGATVVSASSLELGKAADLLILNISDYRELAEQFGMNLVHLTMKRGAFIYKEGGVAPLAAEDLHMAW